MRAVIARVPRLATECVAIDRAAGRVLAADVIAARALPGFDNSAMDGYAARSADLPATVPVAGVIAAGQLDVPALAPGTALRIFTGAPMPAGADTVVIQEDAARDGDRVRLPASPPGDNLRVIGEDIATGETALAAGTRLTAWDVGLLAALGITELVVSRAPRVALIATGDELVDVATPPRPGQLVDSSVHALAALVAEAGGTADRLGIARDDLASLADRLDASLGYDAVITTGGVSVGDRDHVRAALTAAGISLELYKVAMKPGKPFSFGMRGGASPAPVFGLPGNPVSTVVAFELFLRPALLAMQRARVVERPQATVHVAGGYSKPAGRAHYLRARAVRDGEQLIATPHPKQGSAMLSSLVGCNALIVVGAEVTELAPGAPAPAILMEAV
ncbi:MAG: molybdopterin molybdotransferase MoeA [Deltaproteobacteria bacterium]|nr:MAG: molybdopterin molybdotransferase MoeA [Deltaproteobacteria bacterium]